MKTVWQVFIMKTKVIEETPEDYLFMITYEIIILHKVNSAYPEGNEFKKFYIHIHTHTQTAYTCSRFPN